MGPELEKHPPDTFVFSPKPHNSENIFFPLFFFCPELRKNSKTCFFFPPELRKHSKTSVSFCPELRRQGKTIVLLVLSSENTEKPLFFFFVLSTGIHRFRKFANRKRAVQEGSRGGVQELLERVSAQFQELLQRVSSTQFMGSGGVQGGSRSFWSEFRDTFETVQGSRLVSGQGLHARSRPIQFQPCAVQARQRSRLVSGQGSSSRVSRCLLRARARWLPGRGSATAAWSTTTLPVFAAVTSAARLVGRVGALPSLWHGSTRRTLARKPARVWSWTGGSFRASGAAALVCIAPSTTTLTRASWSGSAVPRREWTPTTSSCTTS